MRASTYAIVALLVAPVVSVRPGVAETAPTTAAAIPALAPRAPAPKKWTELRVKNIRATTMAYWLDPKNNREPIELASSRRGLEYVGVAQKKKPDANGLKNAEVGQKSETDFNTVNAPPPTVTLPPQMLENVPPGPGGEALKMPDGVDIVLAADPRQAILAYTNEDGLEKLQQLLPYIDRPLRQVEIECKFIRVPDSSLPALGLNRRTLLAPAGHRAMPQTVQLQAGDLMKTLEGMIAQKEVSVVNGPCVLANNRLASSIVSEVQTPYVVHLDASKGPGKTGEQALVYVPTRTGLTVLPAIKDHQTITTALWTYVNALATQNQVPAAAPEGPGRAYRLLDLQDGTPALVVAWDSQRIEPQERGGTKRTPGVILVMVTARIVHRYEESAALLKNEPFPAGSWW